MKKFINFPSAFSFALFIMSVLIVQNNSALVIVTPPPIVFDVEPELVVIPNTYVYYVTKDDNDLFFCNGFWWRPWHDGWYRAEIYSGPWVVVEPKIVPLAVINLPAGWRVFPPDVVRVRWGDVRLYWRDWDHDRYWDHHGWRGPYFRDYDRHYRDRDYHRGRWHR